MIRQNRSDADHHPGIPLVDIREYFGSGEDQKPGKKGISLKLEEVNEMLYHPYYNGIDDGHSGKLSNRMQMLLTESCPVLKLKINGVNLSTYHT